MEDLIDFLNARFLVLATTEQSFQHNGNSTYFKSKLQQNILKGAVLPDIEVILGCIKINHYIQQDRWLLNFCKLFNSQDNYIVVLKATGALEANSDWPQWMSKVTRLSWMSFRKPLMPLEWVSESRCKQYQKSAKVIQQRLLETHPRATSGLQKSFPTCTSGIRYNRQNQLGLFKISLKQLL